ncbi:MAG: hypothetical protein AAGA56_20895 [Myxococcota bacterium]
MSQASIKVSLSQPKAPEGLIVPASAPPLLDPAGPEVVLGGADPMVGAVAPSASSMFGPRGAHLFSDGSLWVADTGHHRLLGWRQTPIEDGTPADWVIGQPDFESEGRNALAEYARAGTLNVPTGVSTFAGHGGLVVADAWNNRVLIWRERPTASHVPADIILGQADPQGQVPNRGGEPTASTMHWPFATLVVGDQLFVADAGNRRILIWNELPTETGQPADAVLGQPHLTSRSDNGGTDAGPKSMRWPHGLAVSRGRLIMSDAGDNRVLIWNDLPRTDNVPADMVLGQADFVGVDHNQSSYWPRADTMNMPYALAAYDDLILVGDTANSRLLGFSGLLNDGAEASRLSGQDGWQMKGDNRWGPAVRDSVCWPYGLQTKDDIVVVADTGNHRICLWRLAAS